jgi:hypothetical protein
MEEDTKGIGVLLIVVHVTHCEQNSVYKFMVERLQRSLLTHPVTNRNGLVVTIALPEFCEVV